MSFAPATRYSDRDVRENTELFDIAARYLQSYRGDFEYLQDCQRHYTVNGSLTVAMTRGVLNCMRNDPRVAGDLPAPKYGAPDTEATVTPIDRKKKNKRKNKGRRGGINNPRQCEKPESHRAHSWDDHNEWCNGVPFAINREGTYVPARFKPGVKFVLARGGKMIHGIAPEGNHGFVWVPKQNEYGWLHEDWELFPFRVDLDVKLICKYPSWLRNPYLLRESDILRDGLHHGDLYVTPFCRHCFPEGI